MNRRTMLTSVLATALASCDVLPDTTRKPISPTAKQVCVDLLRLANKVQKAQLSRTDRDWLSEALDGMSRKLQQAYNVPALCDTDTSCDKLVGGTE